MGKPSDCPGFAGLLREWDKRLADSGFEDIEKTTRTNRRELKRSGTMVRFEQQSPVAREARAHYFDIIGEKIVETDFEDEQEKQILTLYFEGFTKVEVAEKLSLHRVTVWKKLGKWLKHWGLK